MVYRAIDKHGNPVDFLLTAQRDLDAAKRFFRKMLQEEPLLSPDRIGTDGAGSYPPAIAAARKDGLLARTPAHYVTKHLQQGIESDHFRVKRPMPRIGCFQAFHTARRTIQGFEAMLWLRKGFGFAGAWTVCEQNRLLAVCFGLPEVNKGKTWGRRSLSCALRQSLRHVWTPLEEQEKSSGAVWPVVGCRHVFGLCCGAFHAAGPDGSPKIRSNSKPTRWKRLSQSWFS